MRNFYIVVSPLASKFAKALQTKLKEITDVNVYRRLTPKRTRRGTLLPYFAVTSQPLNKIEQFRRFSRENISSPKYALSPEGAREIDCKTLFARTIVNGTNGRGIVEFERDSEEYPIAPLYTEYIPKKAEYRVHVFGGKVIDVQQKKKKREFNADNRDTRIRNLHNGYVYCRDGINLPDGATDLAIRAVGACNYVYGAVDIIYNERRNQCFVLEVNSRPGLMGTTLENYADAIKEMYNL